MRTYEVIKNEYDQVCQQLGQIMLQRTNLDRQEQQLIIRVEQLTSEGNIAKEVDQLIVKAEEKGVASMFPDYVPEDVPAPSDTKSDTPKPPAAHKAKKT